MDQYFYAELTTATLLKLGSFLFWGWLYIWVGSKSKKDSPEWCSRAVTLLHGTVASIVGLSQCRFNYLTKLDFTLKVLPKHYALMVWSWGYFAFDLLWCLIYWRDNLLMLIHHSSALIAITIYMNKISSGCTFSCTIAIMEITNPFLQTRWFLRNEGYDKTVLFKITEIFYLVMFLFLRGIFGTYVIYKVFQEDIFDMEGKMLSLVFYFVSLAFIYEIFGYVIYKYSDKLRDFQSILEEMGLILNDEI